MIEDGVIPQGFDQATGRMNFCPACRKPLPAPAKDQVVVVCLHCRSETSLPPPLSVVEQSHFRVESSHGDSMPSPTIDSSSGTSTSVYRPVAIDDGDDSFELKLEPEAERIVPTVDVAAWTPSSLPSIPTDDASPRLTQYAAELDHETRSEQAKHSYNQSAGLYPRERSYPTLEAMQRLYKVFGYVTVMIVFPYIGFRFLYLLITTKQHHLQVFAEFSEFAVPVLFGSVAITASLFAAAEGIRLAMDIQDNTLRIANSQGRRKPN